VSSVDARDLAPRSSHAGWEPAAARDPVALLEGEAATRVPELVPIRHARMAASPFAFFRGGAGVMAADLADTPTTGIRVQLCGDAHLSNFGGFAAPDRTMVFDVNDFDETLPGPWEWDLKRLAASLEIAARERGFGASRRNKTVRIALGEYRQAIRRFAQMTALEVWYARLDERRVSTDLLSEMSAKEGRRVNRTLEKARSKDSTRAFAKLGYRVNGEVRIRSDPPLITPIEDLVPEAERRHIDEFMATLIGRYRDTLPAHHRRLLDRYKYAHAARKVVGVGSVGTRAWVLLLVGIDHGDPLFLQAKEAGPSALEPYAGASELDSQGERVVEGQRLIQAASDIFLGWVTTEGLDGQVRDFYVRQLWDWKASADIARITPNVLGIYARLCAVALARAHARTGDARAIGAYAGSGDKLDRALATFAERYADQNERDYEAFIEAIDSGRLAAGGV
jgi:uncharacterized protein (DUF2252 family)